MNHRALIPSFQDCLIDAGLPSRTSSSFTPGKKDPFGGTKSMHTRPASRWYIKNAMVDGESKERITFRNRLYTEGAAKA